MQGQTLTGEVNQASLVLFGTLANAKLNLGAGGFEQGSTDLQIEAVIKKHDILGDKDKKKDLKDLEIQLTLKEREALYWIPRLFQKS